MENVENNLIIVEISIKLNKDDYLIKNIWQLF